MIEELNIIDEQANRDKINELVVAYNELDKFVAQLGIDYYKGEVQKRKNT